MNEKLSLQLYCLWSGIQQESPTSPANKLEKFNAEYIANAPPWLKPPNTTLFAGIPWSIFNEKETLQFRIFRNFTGAEEKLTFKIQMYS